jgi:elongation factor Ts
VALAVKAGKGAVIELNSETDFVARNADFQKAAAQFAQIALKAKDHEALLAAPAPSGEGSVADEVTRLIATIGENILLRRSAQLAVKKGAIVAYVHNKVEGNDDVGRIGVLVALESSGDKGALEGIGRKLAQHIAAAAPIALTEADVPADRIEREKAVLAEQIKEDPKAQGKPAQVIEKMLEGRLRKYLEDVVLLKQAFVHNPDQTVEAAVKEAEKAAGAPVKLTGFVRFAVGEGVEKKSDDFAAEVAAMTNKPDA